jgi:hypothetical protein
MRARLARASRMLTPDIYDPTVNPLYLDVLTYYGALPPK